MFLAALGGLTSLFLQQTGTWSGPNIGIVNFAGVSLAGYSGVRFMNSNTFCGTACHTVMEPEFVRFQSSKQDHESLC